MTIEIISFKKGLFYKYLGRFLILINGFLLGLMTLRFGATPYFEVINAPIWLYIANSLTIIILLIIGFNLTFSSTARIGYIDFTDNSMTINQSRVTETIDYKNLTDFNLKFDYHKTLDDCLILEFKSKFNRQENYQIWVNENVKSDLFKLTEQLKEKIKNGTQQ
jgi:hypothetical protein